MTAEEKIYALASIPAGDWLGILLFCFASALFLEWVMDKPKKRAGGRKRRWQ